MYKLSSKILFLLILINTSLLHSQTQLINEIKGFKPDLAIKLIKNGADVNAYLFHKENHEHSHNCAGHDYNRSPLFWAVLRGYCQVADTLIRNKANINFKNAHGKTALHIAVSRYDYKMTQLLLNNNAEVNIKDAMGNTPLTLASYAYTVESNLDIQNKIKKIIKLLIKNNATLSIINNRGQKASDFNVIQQIIK